MPKRDAPAFVDVATAFDANGDELRRALAVADDRLRELDRDAFERVAQQRRRADRRRRAIGAIAALPVAAMTKLSLVDVSPSTVAPLNETSAISRASASSSGAVDRRVGGDEREHRRHVGMDHPGALRDAGDRDVDAVDADLPRRALRHGVGRHDRARGGEPAVGARRARARCGRPSTIRSTGSGSMITPVENGSTCCGRAAEQPRHGGARRARMRRGPRSPVPAFALPALTTSARKPMPALARRRVLAAHRHRRGAEAVLREHAARHGAGIGDDEQHVVAVPVLDPRRGGAERDARHGQQRLSVGGV